VSRKLFPVTPVTAAGLVNVHPATTSPPDMIASAARLLKHVAGWLITSTPGGLVELRDGSASGPVRYSNTLAANGRDFVTFGADEDIIFPNGVYVVMPGGGTTSVTLYAA